MRKKEESSLILVVIGIILIMLVSNLILLISFNYAHTWKYSADYDAYSKEFNILKDYVLEEFPNESDKWLSVSVTNDKGRALYDPDINDLMECPDEVINALETLCDFGFPDKDSDLDVIRIHGDRVSFCIENGHYALVYSPDEKPTWVNGPKEEGGVFVKSLEDGWYHVTTK